jgi:hypothetical protein
MRNSNLPEVVSFYNDKVILLHHTAIHKERKENEETLQFQRKRVRKRAADRD